MRSFLSIHTLIVPLLASVFLSVAWGKNAQAGEIDFFAPREATPLVFYDSGDKPRGLEEFKGSVVLLNFWATWCVPCVVEMPALNTLSKELAPKGLKIIAVSEDYSGVTTVQQFYTKWKLEHLEVFMDKQSAGLRNWKVKGLPTSYLLNREGRVIAEIQGSREWDKEKMRKELREMLE